MSDIWGLNLKGQEMRYFLFFSHNMWTPQQQLAVLWQFYALSETPY